MNTSKAGRLLKLGPGLAKASIKFVSSKISHKLTDKLQATQEIINTMGEMKGVLMKLGQMISISEDLVFPNEISVLFAKLQNDATPMKDSDLNRVFKDSFNKLPEEVFIDFDRKPIAQASIGQVHKAKLIDPKTRLIRNVAIKVQYPDIQKAIVSDLSNLNGIKNLLELFSINKLKIDHFIQELRESILLECDYLNEAYELEYFHNKIKNEFEQIKIPFPIMSHTTNKILTQDFFMGDSFEKAKSYRQEERDFLGTLLYESYLYELFTLKKIHSDPQNGNYLFRRDSFIKLDFGSTKTFDENFILNYCLILMSLEQQNLNMYRYAAIELHFIYPTDSLDFIQQQFEFLYKLYAPLLKKGTYSLDEVDVFSWVKDYIKNVDLSVQRSPRKEFLMLDRANLGLFTKVKQLKSKINWEFGRKKYRAKIDQMALELYKRNN